MSQGDRRRVTALLVAIALLVAGLALLWRSGGDDAPYDYIAAKAGALGHDAAEIDSYVSGLRDDGYAGALRGPVGALWAGGGNDVDRAGLRAALRRASGLAVEPAQEPTPHLLEVRARVTVGGELQDEQVVRLETTSLAGDALVVRFSAEGYALSRLSGERLAEGKRGFDEEEALTLHFQHTPPAGEPTLWRRELYTGAYADVGRLDDPRNVHVALLLPGRIDRWAYEQELELAKGQEDPASEAYRLALTHAVESDRLLPELCAELGVSAAFSEPRTLIASLIYVAEHDDPVARALDLRRNRVTATGEAQACAAFQVARSAYEAELEGSVLEELTSGTVFSAAKVLSAVFAEEQAGVSRRVGLYADALTRLLDEAPPGSTLTLGQEPAAVALKAAEDAIEVVAVGDSLRAAMAESGAPFASLTAERFAREAIGLAAVELEALLGPLAGASPDYEPGIELDEPPSELLREEFRTLSYRMGKLTFERRIARLEQGARIESVDHWDDLQQRRINRTDRLRVPEAVLQEGRVFTTWHAQSYVDAGALPAAFSQVMLRELKEQGYTDVRYMKADRTLTEPLRLYLCKEVEWQLSLDGQPVQVPIWLVYGTWASEQAPKPEDFRDVEPIYENPEKQAYRMNGFSLAVETAVPIVLYGQERLQTRLACTVVSAETGRAVAGAKVQVAGNAGRSRFDGRAVVPLLDRPLQSFTLVATHPEYARTVVEVDLRETDPQGWEIELAPRPVDASEWIQVSTPNRAETLPQIEDPRLRDLVAAALDDDPALVARVPSRRVHYGFGSPQAYLLLEPTGAFTVAGDDGLYGSSSLDGAIEWMRWLESQVDTAKQLIELVERNTAGPPDPKLGEKGINAYAGFVASWYAYSAGRLEAVNLMMQGLEPKNLGHDLALSVAVQFLGRMQRLNQGLSGEILGQLHFDVDAYAFGFGRGLAALESIFGKQAARDPGQELEGEGEGR